MNRRIIAVIALLISTIVLAGVEESFQRVQTQNFSRPDSNKIKILNPAGTTSITVSETDQVIFSYRLYAEAADYNKSRELVGKFETRIRPEKGVITANFGLPFDSIDKLKFPFLDRKFEGTLQWRDRKIDISHKKGTILKVELRVEIPSGIDVEIEGMIGKVDITGHRGNIDIEMGAGEIELFQTVAEHKILLGTGVVKSITSEGGFDISAEKIDILGTFTAIDTLRISQKEGAIRFDGVESATWLDLKIGNANLYLMAGDLGCGSIKSGAGNIDLKIYSRLNCEMSIETESGYIDIETAKRFAQETYSTTHGRISHIEIESPSTEVEVSHPFGSGIMRAKSDSGNMKIVNDSAE